MENLFDDAEMIERFEDAGVSLVLPAKGYCYVVGEGIGLPGAFLLEQKEHGLALFHIGQLMTGGDLTLAEEVVRLDCCLISARLCKTICSCIC